MGISREDVKNRVTDFLKVNSKAPKGLRPILVEDLTSGLLADGCTLAELGTWEIKHPKLMKKATLRRHSILEVLADFIMDVNMIEERSREYPVMNAEAEMRREETYRRKEVGLILDAGHDEDSPAPYGTIEEHTFNVENPVESALFSDYVNMSRGEFLDLIRHVKQNIEKYVRRYADNKAWNDRTPNIRRSPTRVRNRILNLDESRVRECRVCGNAFYAHDDRQIICDILPYRKNRKHSVCQYSNIQLYQQNKEKSTKILEKVII